MAAAMDASAARSTGLSISVVGRGPAFDSQWVEKAHAGKLRGIQMALDTSLKAEDMQVLQESADVIGTASGWFATKLAVKAEAVLARTLS